MRTIEETPKALPDDHDGNPIPKVPLFPLLPSVQTFFAAFCQDQSDPFSSPEKKNGQIGQFGRSDPAGRSYREPKEILGAPLCGESLF